MLGLILIYFIGKTFAELAHEYDRSKWGYAIGAVVFYYLSTFVIAFVLVMFFMLIGSDFIDRLPSFVLDLICLPFGLLACWGAYRLLEKHFIKESSSNESMENKLKRIGEQEEPEEQALS